MPKETKLQISETNIQRYFDILSMKKELFKSDHQKYGLGGVPPGSTHNLSIHVYVYKEPVK